MKWITTFLLIAMCPLSAAPVPPLSTAQQVRDHWAFKPVSNPVPPRRLILIGLGTRWINLFSNGLLWRAWSLPNVPIAARSSGGLP